MSEETFEEMRLEYLALVITVVDIVNGAAYLFDKKKPEEEQKWKELLELECHNKIIKRGIIAESEYKSGGCE